MTDTSPAALLRQAANKLHRDAKAAHRASPAPWKMTAEHVVRSADDMIVADRSGTGHPAERADLPYIEAVHPGVGDALAKWLDSAAEDAEQIGANPCAVATACAVLGQPAREGGPLAPQQPHSLTGDPEVAETPERAADGRTAVRALAQAPCLCGAGTHLPRPLHTPDCIWQDPDRAQQIAAEAIADLIAARQDNGPDNWADSPDSPDSPVDSGVDSGVDAETDNPATRADSVRTGQDTPPMDPVHILGVGTTAAPDEQCLAHIKGACDGTTSDCVRPSSDDTLRFLRRESLLVLLTRLQRGRTLTKDEARTLRQHVETEIHEANTARRSAEQADAVTAETKRLLERRTTTLRQRAERAEVTVARVRAVVDQADSSAARWHDQYPGLQWIAAIRTALDGAPTEQPTPPTTYVEAQQQHIQLLRRRLAARQALDDAWDRLEEQAIHHLVRLASTDDTVKER